MKINLLYKVSFLIVFLTSCQTTEYSEKISKCEFSHLDGENGREHIENLIANSFLEIFSLDVNKGFLKLDNLANQLENKNCLLADGKTPVNFVYAGFSKAFKSFPDKEKALSKINEIQNKHPDEVYPILSEALFWTLYAWDARGRGYASTVTKEGWNLFYERLGVSEEILIRTKSISSKSPVWYQLMYQPIFHLKKPEEIKEKLYSEGFSRHSNFLPLYILKRNQLRPRWGGSWEEVDDFINWSSENTQKNEGMGMYARLYFGVYTNLRRDENLYEDTFADWRKLKSGLRDLVRIYPTSQFHKNIFALLACESNDKTAYHEIRPQISDHSRWRWSYKKNVRSCDQMFEYSPINVK